MENQTQKEQSPGDNPYPMFTNTLPSFFSERLRQLLEASPDTWIIIESTGKIISASRQAEELFGYAGKELSGREIDILLPDRYLEEGKKFLKEYFINPFAWRMGRVNRSIYAIKKDGTEFNAEVGFQAVDTDEGLWVISSIKDETLQKSLFFTSFMDHTPVLTWISDRNENMVYASRSLLNYFGILHDPKGKNILELFPQKMADAIHKDYKKVLEKGCICKRIIKLENANREEKVFQLTILLMHGVAAEKMVGGEARDITETYKLRQRLLKTNERLIYISRTVSDAIWDWNMQAGTIFRNRALLNMIGFQDYKSADLSWWYLRIHPEDRKRVRNKVRDVLENKEKVWEDEYRFRCADNCYKSIHDRGYIVYENDQPIRMIGSLQDISEIKELEAKLNNEKLKQQEEMAVAVTQAQDHERTYIGCELHDNVNQVLFSAALYLDAINAVDEESAEIKKKTRSFILMAIEEIRNLSRRLVNRPLKEKGLIPGINDLVADLVFFDLFEIEFSHEDDCKIESIGQNRKTALFRIVQELIKNIIKYSHAKKVSIRLSVRQGCLSLLVQDDGIGFDILQTGEGIGLSNIRERCRVHHGTARLQTAPGKGCSVTIEIPLDPA